MQVAAGRLQQGTRGECPAVLVHRDLSSPLLRLRNAPALRGCISWTHACRGAARGRGIRHCAARTDQQQRQHQHQSQQSSGPVRPVRQTARAFAPATVANLGVGFDWLGCAVEGDGDVVVATALEGEPGEVRIAAITGDGGRLPLDAAKNCVGIAAAETLKLLEAVLGPLSAGVSLHLDKGLPLGSGLGSSAASAAAAAAAVNGLWGGPLSAEALVPAGLLSEAAVSGYHADNIAPALMGGFTLVRSAKPLDLQRLQYAGADLWFALVNPLFEAPTAEMRAALPREVPMASQIHNAAMGGTLVAAICQGNAAELGRALDSDVIVEPVRGPLIPGFSAVKAAAKAAGAYGCTISGAGPTCVAVAGSQAIGEKAASAMAAAFQADGGLQVNFSIVVKVDSKGAYVMDD